MTPYPKPNPQYREDPPALSKDGKVVRMSIEAIHRQQEHNRIYGVKPAQVKP